jgi:hypothetical protein
VHIENNKIKNNRIKFITLAVSSLLFIVFLFGCNSKDLKFSTTESTLPRSNISVDELQDLLDEFEELFTSRIKSAASEIDFRSADPKIMKMTLLWRSRAIPALHNFLEQQKPMAVLIDSWLLSKRLTNYIDSGEAGNIFGDYKSIALDASNEIEVRIEAIASDVLNEEVFKKTNDNLRNLALANPIQSGFTKLLIYSQQAEKSQPGLLESAFKIPLSPVRALEGVDRAPEAIYDFSNTTRRLSDVVQELPESTRWQLLLLLYDLEETNMTKSFLSSLQNIAQSSTKLSAFTEQLPTLLEDSDKSQEQIRNTLAQINETVAGIRELFNDVQKTAAVFSNTATVFSQTAKDVNTVAVSWAQAARATDSAISHLKPQKNQTGSEPANKTDFKETAQAVKDAANEIKTLSETLPTQTEQLVAQLNLLSTRVTINIAILIVLIFCLSVIYCIVRKKVGIPKK